ncbi:hypothetical protein [Niallia sp. 03133]|uniref:hypothetical protein n=1 Tax=Niallia sp. 03133 TaxID=3458060 RepID=UPI004044C9E9
MKILGIFFVVLVSSLLMVMAMDFLIGDSLSQSLDHLIDPFRAMHAGEYVILAGLIIIVVGQQIVMIRKEKSEKAKGSS